MNCVVRLRWCPRWNGAKHPAATPREIINRLHEGWTEGAGGGIWWRREDDFKAAPANGPAAILLARDGQSAFAAAISDWMAETLIDPDSGLVRQAVRSRTETRE